MKIRFKYCSLIVKITLVVLIMASGNWVLAQYTDTKMRMAVDLEREIFDDFSISMELEQRFHKQISRSEKSFLEPSVKYKINKRFDIYGTWRVVLFEDDEGFKMNKHRYSVAARYEIPLHDFEINVKSILQYGFDDITNPSLSIKQNLVNRYSVKIDYDWFGKKINPYVKYELFYHLNHQNGGIVNQTRIEIGGEYEFDNYTALELFYMFEDEFNVVEPVDAHIFGVKLKHDF